MTYTGKSADGTSLEDNTPTSHAINNGHCSVCRKGDVKEIIHLYGDCQVNSMGGV